MTECIDDSDSRIAYSDGWHTGTSSTASGGHFHFHNGGSAAHSASLSFEVPDGRVGEITYAYGTSTKGGNASVFLDGQPSVVSYVGTTGAAKDPVMGASKKFSNLAPGTHTLEIKNLQGTVYLDGFCTKASSPQGEPDTFPGTTSTQLIALTPGEFNSSLVPVDDDMPVLSVFAEETSNLPFRLVLLRPSGTILATVDSAGGIASLTTPVSSSGLYTVKVINLSLTKAKVWTAVTPTVMR